MGSNYLNCYDREISKIAPKTPASPVYMPCIIPTLMLFLECGQDLWLDGFCLDWLHCMAKVMSPVIRTLYMRLHSGITGFEEAIWHCEDLWLGPEDTLREVCRNRVTPPAILQLQGTELCQQSEWTWERTLRSRWECRVPGPWPTPYLQLCQTPSRGPNSIVLGLWHRETER